MSTELLSSIVTGRKFDLFGEDIRLRDGELKERFAGRRVLVVGGAGSIGSSTVRALLDYRPAAVHVVDQNENGLAELIRDLRSTLATMPQDFRALPLDFGAPPMRLLLESQPAYDVVFNFAALKHVRSEKDVFSALQLLDTNVVKAARVLRWLEDGKRLGRYFAVSTDKAANPVNLMGASKRAMEHVMFSGEVVTKIEATSARFANVAFSDGSLLWGFLRRIEKRQPIAVPTNTKRYFITLRESGQICLLAAACAPVGSLLVPRMGTGDLVDLETVAVATVRHHGFEPVFFDDESKSREQLSHELSAGRYPILRTPRDTSGEKSEEVFVGQGEQSCEVGIPNLLSVAYVPPRQPGTVKRFLELLERLASGAERDVTKAKLVAALGDVVPEFQHAETGRSLDQRM